MNTISEDKFLIYKEEAQAKNLTLLQIYKSKNNDLVGEYMFNKCGHKQNKPVANVRHQASSFCWECSSTDLLKCSKEKGLELTGLSTDGNIVKRNFRVIACGHTFDLFYSNIKIKHGLYKCPICLDTKYKEYLNKHHLQEVNHTTIIPYYLSLSTKYADYCRTDCGHSLTQLRTLTKPPPECKECKKEKFSELLVERGLEYIGKALEYTEDRYSRYKLISCGHERDIDKVCITRNNYKCHTCKTGFIQKLSNIYLYHVFFNGFSFLKLGYSKNTENRIREYGLIENAEITLLKEIPISSGKLAMTLENTIHSKYQTNKLDHSLMKNYFRRTGHTECYPISMKSTLIKELEDIEDLNGKR